MTRQVEDHYERRLFLEAEYLYQLCPFVPILRTCIKSPMKKLENSRRMMDEAKVREAIGRTAAGRRTIASAERLRGSMLNSVVEK